MNFDARCRNISFATVRAEQVTDARGVDVVVVVAKMVYLIAKTGRITLDYSPVRVSDVGDEGGGLKYPYDFAEEKRGTDVGLVGHAHPPKGSQSPPTQVDVTLAVGELRKTVRAFGPRVYQKGMIGVAPGPSGPIVEPVPLRYDLAFGGIDQSDPADYRRERYNPIGRGVARDKSTLIDTPAHQLEPRNEPGMPACPDAQAAFAPIPPSWEPRATLAGTHDVLWAKARAPYRPLDFNPRHHNWSSATLWSEEPLRPDVPIEVTNATEEGLWRFALPKYELLFGATIYRPAEAKEVQDGYPSHLDGILIDADERKVELTWRAAVELPRKWEHLKEIVITGSGELSPEVVGDPPYGLPSAQTGSEAREQA